MARNKRTAPRPVFDISEAHKIAIRIADSIGFALDPTKCDPQAVQHQLRAAILKALLDVVEIALANISINEAHLFASMRALLPIIEREFAGNKDGPWGAIQTARDAMEALTRRQ